METVRTYVLRIVVCCLVCAIAYKIVEKNSTHQRIVKLMAGMIIMLTAISPLMDLNRPLNFQRFEEFAWNANEYVSQGTLQYKNEWADRIVQRSEAYVLEKAAQMHVSLEIEITLSDDEIPAPVAAKIKGNISPFVKSRLINLLENDLGISKERQEWT